MQKPIFFFWQFSLVWIICAAMMTIVCVCTMCTHSLTHSLYLSFSLLLSVSVAAAVVSGRAAFYSPRTTSYKYNISIIILYIVHCRDRVFFSAYRPARPVARSVFRICCADTRTFFPSIPCAQYLSFICLGSWRIFLFLQSRVNLTRFRADAPPKRIIFLWTNCVNVPPIIMNMFKWLQR